MALLFFLFLAATLSKASPDKETIPGHKVHLLRLRSDAGVEQLPALSCLSWRLAVETHNMVDWVTVPGQCEDYVGNYMLGDQYRKDSSMVTNQAILHAQNLTLGLDGKDVWVFDVDETTLSNLPYYARHGFGVEPYNSELFNKWVMEGEALALPESLKLYEKLLSLGVRVVFLTGRPEDQRNVTSNNLREAGYHTWEKLVLKGASYSGKKAMLYKSRERGKLEKSGYRIIGNIGDQWSDILGTNVGNRTFKLPDPMYYIG